MLLNAISSGSAVPAPSSSNRLSSAAPSDASRPPVTQSRPAAKAVGSSPSPDLPLNQVDLYPHHPSSFYPSHEGLSLDDANQEGTTLEEQHLALQELLEQYRAQPADVEGQEEDGELGEKERMGQVGVGRIPEEDGLLVLDASTSNGVHPLFTLTFSGGLETDALFPLNVAQKRKADGPLPNPASYSYDHVRAELNAIVKDGFGSGRLTKLECSHPIGTSLSSPSTVPLLKSRRADDRCGMDVLTKQLLRRVMERRNGSSLPHHSFRSPFHPPLHPRYIPTSPSLLLFSLLSGQNNANSSHCRMTLTDGGGVQSRLTGFTWVRLKDPKRRRLREVERTKRERERMQE